MATDQPATEWRCRLGAAYKALENMAAPNSVNPWAHSANLPILRSQFVTSRFQIYLS